MKSILRDVKQWIDLDAIEFHAMTEIEIRVPRA